MLEESKRHYKYASSPYENVRENDLYLSSKEIQEKRGEDLARRLYNFRKSLKDVSYISSPISYASSDDSLEKVFLYEFTHLSDIGRRKFASLIWEKNVEEEISRIWPDFSKVVSESLKNI